MKVRYTIRQGEPVTSGWAWVVKRSLDGKVLVVFAKSRAAARAEAVNADDSCWG